MLWARLTSSFLECVRRGLLRNEEGSLGVPEPPTKRETTSAPVLGVPFNVAVVLLSKVSDSGECPVVGVAVASDILVVVAFEGVL